MNELAGQCSTVKACVVQAGSISWGAGGRRSHSVPRAEANHPDGELRQLNSHMLDPGTNGRFSGRGSLLGQGVWKGWRLITEARRGGPESYLGIFRVNIKTN